MTPTYYRYFNLLYTRKTCGYQMGFLKQNSFDKDQYQLDSSFDVWSNLLFLGKVCWINTGVGKKGPFTEIVTTFFYWSKSYQILQMHIQISWDIIRYNCTPKSSFKCVNTFINYIFGILLHYSTMASFKESRSVILRPRYRFPSRSPQIPKSTGFKFGLFDGPWWSSCNRNCFCLSTFQERAWLCEL